jgi:hypothetical protein
VNVLVLVIGVLALGTQAAASDLPNETLEQNFNQAYQLGRPPVEDDQWRNLVGDRLDQVYVVQKGDTLWDLSQAFFGDGFFWSKLWSENPEIGNPHRIRPGRQIGFVAGTIAAEPSVTVDEGASLPPQADGTGTTEITPGAPNLADAPAESAMSISERVGADGTVEIVANEDENAAGAKSAPPIRSGAPIYAEDLEAVVDNPETNQLLDRAEIFNRPLIPKPPRSRRAISRLPPSFLEQQIVPKGFDELGLSIEAMPAAPEPEPEFLRSFATESEPGVVATLVEMEAQELLASLGQRVFLSSRRALNRGEILTVFRPSYVLSVEKRKLGDVFEVSGRVRVLGPATVERDESGSGPEAEQPVYLAEVVSSINPLVRGSFASADPLPLIEPKSQGSPSAVVAQIIGAELSRAQKIASPGALVYLDKGSSAGLREGDLLPVQASRKSRRGMSKLPGLREPAGLLKVVKVTPELATAVVLKSVMEIVVGDTTGGSVPALLGEIQELRPNEVPRPTQAGGASLDFGAEPEASPADLESEFQAPAGDELQLDEE